MHFIPLMQPDISEDDIAAVTSVLRSGMLVQGKNSEAFEQTIAAFLGCRHVVTVANGTASLHLALAALNIRHGHEVIVPAFSYPATANVVELVGATPVFVDIQLSDFNIDVSKIEQAITPKTKAIIPVHEFGVACEISKLMEISEKHNLFVVEDAACALGAKENGKHVGSFGGIGSFSLHPRKSITSGEGGFITTNDNALASKIRVLRNHGMKTENGKMIFEEAGFNYRLTDFQCALALSQFKRYNDIVKRKQEIAEIYLNGLASNTKLQLPATFNNRNHTWQTFHTIVSDSISRDVMIDKLRKKNIGTNYGAQCIPIQDFYFKKYNLDCAKLFPNAMHAYMNGIAFPMYNRLKDEEVKYIVQTVNELTGN